MPIRDGAHPNATRAGSGAEPAAGADLTARLGRSRSVTDLLERLAGETVDARIQAQTRQAAGPRNPLGLDPGAEVVARSVLLCGRTSGRRLVYAETLVATTRLPETVLHRLEHTCDPIGRVLQDNGLVVGRELLPGRARAWRARGSIASTLTTSVLDRRYRLLVGSEPAFAVDEWFLEAVASALQSHRVR